MKTLIRLISSLPFQPTVSKVVLGYDDNDQVKKELKSDMKAGRNLMACDSLN